MKNEGWGALASFLDRFMVARAYKAERKQATDAVNREFESKQAQQSFENQLSLRKSKIDEDWNNARIEAEKAQAELYGNQAKNEAFELQHAPDILADTRRKTQSEIDENNASASSSRASASANTPEGKLRELLAKGAIEAYFDTPSAGGGNQNYRDTTDEELLKKADSQARETFYGKPGIAPGQKGQKPAKPFQTPHYKMKGQQATIDSIAADRYQGLYGQFRPEGFGQRPNPLLKAIGDPGAVIQSMMPGVKLPERGAAPAGMPTPQRAIDPVEAEVDSTINAYMQDPARGQAFRQRYEADPEGVRNMMRERRRRGQ